MSDETSDTYWQRKCDAFAEVATRAVESQPAQGFWNAMRWLVVHHADAYGLHALAEYMSAKSRRCVPDGWAMGVHEGQVIVAVFEQDDTHEDLPKWHDLASAFDDSSYAWLVEVRRRYNGPLMLRSEGTMCLDEVDGTYTPLVVAPREWSTVGNIGPATKTTTQRLSAWQDAWLDSGDEEDHMCDSVHLEVMG